MPRPTDSATDLTQQRLKELVSYNPATGEFVWIGMESKKACVLIGKRAGTFHKKSGYWKICIDRRIYKAARLAWLYMTGEWPSGDIDHEDTNRSNDTWSNLRDATNAQNHWNTKKRTTNTSGFKGVTWDSARGKWQARITVNYKMIHLGRFATAEEAAAAYWSAATKNFGEFARAA